MMISTKPLWELAKTDDKRTIILDFIIGLSLGIAAYLSVQYGMDHAVIFIFGMLAGGLLVRGRDVVVGWMKKGEDNEE